jgi:uncharacterized protein
MHPFLIQHRRTILDIARRHGVGNVRVFGSMARGDVSATSDIDLLVEITGPVTPWFPGGLMADLEDLLGRRVEVATEEELHDKIRDQVLKEAVPL